jgi:hypothetical protein
MKAGVDQILPAVTALGVANEFAYGGGGGVQPQYREMGVRMGAFSTLG